MDNSPNHIVTIEQILPDRALSTARQAACQTCGWRGAQRSTLELAVDDALGHEGSDHEVVRKVKP